MALITGALLFVFSVFTAALSRLIADDLKAWNSWAIRRILLISVIRLPENLRERFNEEWGSHLNEVPGDIGKLFTAAGFLLAANGMRLHVQHDELIERVQRNLVLFDGFIQRTTTIVNLLRQNSCFPTHELITPHLERVESGLVELVKHREMMETAAKAALAMPSGFFPSLVCLVVNKAMDSRYLDLMQQIERADIANNRIMSSLYRTGRLLKPDSDSSGDSAS